MEQPRPDSKDWTWVLDRPCPDCGFDSSTLDRSQIGARLRANAASWRSVLGRGDIVHERPPSTPETGPIWSALEYGAHVRDVYKVFLDRFTLMLKKKNPTFANWDQDATAAESNYADLDPGKVGYDLASTAGKVADILDRVSGDQWQRTGTRSNGSEFTVETLAAYLLHDPVHHLWDVEQGFEAITESQQ